MIKRQQATNPKSKRYHRYTKRLEMKSDVPFITVFGRLTCLDKMLSRGWTIEEIYMTLANTKQILNPNTPKPKGYGIEELLEEYNKKHHHSVSWQCARKRYWQGLSIDVSCNRPISWRPKSYKKKTTNYFI